MADTPANSSDEDEQRAMFLQQQAKNEQLFVIVRKKCSQEQIIYELQQCLNSGAEINTVNTRGKTILDIARQKKYKDLVKFLSKRGGKAMIDIGYSVHSASFMPQDMEVKSYNCHQETQIPRNTNVEDFKIRQLKSFLQADDKRYLTKDKLLTLNFALKSGLAPQTIIILLTECGININYRDPKTDTSAIDIAWHLEYYDSMILLLEADSKFPENFIPSTGALNQNNNIPEKFKDFVQSRQQLHHWIQCNKLKEIKNFVSYHHLSRYFNSDNKSALETAAEYANEEIIATLITLQYPLQGTTISERQSHLLQQLNSEGNTLLAVAAKSGKSDNVAFFIACGINVNHRNMYNKRAIDLAWANKRYDTVLVLLKADSEFPYNFCLDGLTENEDRKELKRFVEERNEFHKRIEENRLKDIKNITPLDKSKLYLNSYGQSALFTAITKKRFAIYAYLKSLGLEFKNEDEEEYLNDLPLDEKDSLKSAMICEFPQVDKGHILYLISKSRSQKPVESFKEHTEKLFEYLDKIPEISIILQVIQYTDYLDIVFDFDNDNIMDINPTASDSTRGTTDYKDGRIYIAAKTDEKQLSGTLAHELTHLAMFMIYKNDCNPFDMGENEKSEDFKMITYEIQKQVNKIIDNITGNENNPIVTLATSFLYPDNEQQSELIARVPHILAQYPGMGKHLLNTKFKSLYDYYTDNNNEGLFDRCRQFIKNSFLTKPRNSMQFLNETIGEVNNFIKYGMHFAEPTDLDSFLKSNNQVFLVETNSGFLSMINIYESLIIKNKKVCSLQDSLFLQFNSYIEKEDEILKLFYSPIGKILCLCYWADLDNELYIKELKTLKMLLSLKCDKKVILVIQDIDQNISDTIKGMFENNYEQATYHSFTINHFTTECQQMLLERQITFLGKNIELNKFIDITNYNLKLAIDTETLIKLIKGENIVIGRLPPDTSYLEGAYSELFEEVNMKTFIDRSISQNSKDVYIISGITGPNKHVSLFNYINSKIPMQNTDAMSKVNKLKTHIEKLEHFGNTNQNILIADKLFDEKNFQEFCHKNPAGKIYWIHLTNDVKEYKFMLQKMYNPDFYITGKRFNHEVVIDKNVAKELCSSTLSDIFIIEVKQESEILRWFQFKSDHKIQFEANYKRCKIQFVPSLSTWIISYQNRFQAFSNQTVHLLEFRQDQLIWHKTYGSMNKLIQYRAKVHKNILPFIGENGVTEIILDKKVTIVSGDPGTGKTTSLNQICNAKRISQLNKEVSIMESHWVIKINLKDHLQAIRKLNFLNSDTENKSVLREIIDFFLQVEKSLYKSSSKSFAKGLLKHLLRKDNTEKPFLVMFDGFDEILDETNRNKLTLLLQYLKDETNAKLCITTRLHYEKNLEAALSTFALRLEPMENISVLNLVKQYFRSRLRLLLSTKMFLEVFDNNDHGISIFTDAFMIKMQELFKGDVNKFIGTPLQLYLMLEISTEHFYKRIQEKGYLNSQSPDFSYLGSDIWEIYENFVNMKYLIVCNKTRLKEETQLQEHKENLDNYHMDLAKTVINVKTSVKESFKKYQDIVLTAGIIKSDGSNLNFIHSTFTEFFAAKAFIYWINKWQKNYLTKRKNFQKQQFFCSKILCGPNYRVIRSFLNAKLLKEKIKNVQLREKYYNENILFVSAMENHVGIAEFISHNFSNVDINALDCNHHTVLYIAATFVNPEMIKWLVEKGADINARDENGRTVLHIIAKHGSLDIIQWLAERGLDLNDKDKFGRTILHEAAAFGRLEIIKWLVENGVDINSKDNKSLNVLHEIAAFGNIEIVKYLIDKGADFNAVDNENTTVLHVAATYANVGIIKLLIDRGAMIDAQDNYGRNVLHEAAASGTFDVVKCLIDRNADFNAEDKDGKKVLQMAVASNNLEIVVYLIEKGANINDKDKNGKTLLHEAAKYGRFDIVQWLAKKGADINAEDKNGRKILHEAASSGNLDIINFLVDCGADVNIEDKVGKTLLHEAAACGWLDTIKWLIHKGVAVNAEDKNGWKVLHEAAAFGNLDTVKCLVEEGADIDTYDKDGRSVLHVAAEYSNADVVEWLVRNKAKVDVADKYGRTVLHFAIAGVENLGMIEWLVECGADINAKDEDDRTVLHYALAKFGNLEAISWLVENGADTNAKDKEDCTVLHYALSEFGNLDTIKYLVEKGANLNAKRKDGATILHYAGAKFDNLRIVKWLIEKGANINAKDNSDRTVLFYAVAEIGNIETVKWLIDNGADVNAKDNLGNTVLHHAMNGFGNLEEIKLLVDKGANINAKTNSKATVLHYAVDNFENLELVKWLVENGADINARDSSDRTVLFYAVAEIGNLKTVKWLIDKGADIKAQDEDGCTILHHALNGVGNLEEVELLVGKGADINAKDNLNRTILHYAVAESDNIDIIKWLVEKGAEVNCEDIDGLSVLHEADLSDNDEIYRYLIEKGAVIYD